MNFKTMKLCIQPE